MLKKSYCKLIGFLGLCSLLGVLSGCQKNPSSATVPPSEDQFQDISDLGTPSPGTAQQQTPAQQESTQTVSQPNEQVQQTVSQTSSSQEILAQATPTVAKLQINNRCIGCGRCTMIDSSHFASAGHHSKATVISQDNLSSSAVQEAIDSCPASAISLA